ncbi:MAG TPA: Mn-containing catalase [Ruminococcus sp.]|nr:Mn-containing catalase [Ruminococcus sp.]
MAHLEIVGSIVRQLVRNASTEEIENSPFGQYFMNHGRGVFPADATGMPFDANCLAVSGDPIADLVEDLAADATISYAQHE